MRHGDTLGYPTIQHRGYTHIHSGLYFRRTTGIYPTGYATYPITSQHTEPAYILDLTARSACITPPARHRSASRAYARENTLPSSAKWGPFRCSFSERTRMCSQSDPTYRPYYPPIYIPLLM